MEVRKNTFAAQFGILSESVQAVGVPLCGPDQFVHISMHYCNERESGPRSCSNAAAVAEETDGPRPICWAHISENEYIDKNPDWNMRRSDSRCLYSCTITFWSDGRRMECSEDTRDDYKTVATQWLKVYIRNEAGNPDARVADELEDIQRVGDTGDFGDSHSCHHNDDDFGNRHSCHHNDDDFGNRHSCHRENDDNFAVIEGCDGKHEEDYSEFEPEEVYNIYEERSPHFLKRYLPRLYR